MTFYQQIDTESPNQGMYPSTGFQMPVPFVDAFEESGAEDVKHFKDAPPYYVVISFNDIQRLFIKQQSLSYNGIILRSCLCFLLWNLCYL